MLSIDSYCYCANNNGANNGLDQRIVQNASPTSTSLEQKTGPIVNNTTAGNRKSLKVQIPTDQQNNNKNNGQTIQEQIQSQSVWHFPALMHGDLPYILLPDKYSLTLYGAMRLATDKRNPHRKLCIKISSLQLMENTSYEENPFREAAVLSYVRDLLTNMSDDADDDPMQLDMVRQTIVPFVDSFTDHQYHYIVYEQLQGKELFSLLVDEPERASESMCRLWSMQLILTVEWLHRHGIVHCDISPENLFVSPDGMSVCLLDFGMARFNDQYNEQQNDNNNSKMIYPTALGKVRYMSFEMYNHLPCDLFANDLWSIGVTMYVMFVRRPPFDCPSSPDVWFEIICSGQWLVDSKIYLSTQAQQTYMQLNNKLVLFCIDQLVKPQDYRATLVQLFNCPFFAPSTF